MQAGVRLGADRQAEGRAGGLKDADQLGRLEVRRAPAVDLARNARGVGDQGGDPVEDELALDVVDRERVGACRGGLGFLVEDACQPQDREQARLAEDQVVVDQQVEDLLRQLLVLERGRERLGAELAEPGRDIGDGRGRVRHGLGLGLLVVAAERVRLHRQRGHRVGQRADRVRGGGIGRVQPPADLLQECVQAAGTGGGPLDRLEEVGQGAQQGGLELVGGAAAHIEPPLISIGRAAWRPSRAG